MSQKRNRIASTRFCLICNTKTKSKREGIQLTYEVVSTLKGLWDLSPVDPDFPYEDLLICIKCHRSLRKVASFQKQLETLRRILNQLKTGIECYLNKSFVNAAKHFEDDEFVDQRIQTLRTAIIENGGKTWEPEVLPKIHFRMSELIEETSVVTDKVILNSATCSESPEDIIDKPDIPSKDTTDDNEVISSQDNMPSDTDELMSPDESSLCVTTVDRIKCSKTDCRFTFKDEIGRQAHVRKYHEGNTHPFTCNTCEKSFQTRRQLKIHVMGHNGESPFICEQCGQGFRMERLLNDHLKIIHKTGTLSHQCSFCKKYFLNKSKLSSHEAIHTKCYPLSCSTCGKGFRNKSCLRIHSQVHINDNQWQCRECGKTFTTKKAMESHKSIHTGLFKVSCTVCPWGGPSQAALNKHMFKHTDKSNFECQTCSKKFKFPNTLAKHMKIHSNQKNYKCNVCNKSFMDSYKLNRHRQIHEGNRPHECLSCQKRFFTKDALKSHSKVHSKETQPSTTESSYEDSPGSGILCNPDSILDGVNCVAPHPSDPPNNDLSFPDSSEFPLISQIFDPCEFIPCNVSHIHDTESIKTTNLPDLSSPDILSEIFSLSYSGPQN